MFSVDPMSSRHTYYRDLVLLNGGYMRGGLLHGCLLTWSDGSRLHLRVLKRRDRAPTKVRVGDEGQARDVQGRRNINY